ncbi:DNA polymerase III subunit epsilon [Dokdonella sp. MW10]|uniref:DNA polymerase III subunit epsilon n=1 Tax=Dokdonella sp. MW10 TaxID=2992926 RepID=UPI003F7E0E95
MRQVVFDTETTGLEVHKGHRLIEIGCVELLERRQSGRTFHCYLNPGRPVDEGARAVHGISDEFLADKPRFAEVAAEFLAFIDGAELIAHNASFDVGFIDAELALLDAGLGRLRDRNAVLDTLALAREKYPGQQNSLNALCKRLGVSNSHRELHGALVDADLLADVYLAMTAGQGALGFGSDVVVETRRGLAGASVRPSAPLRVLRASPAELEAHAGRLAAIARACKSGSVWARLEAPEPLAGDAAM